MASDPLNPTTLLKLFMSMSSLHYIDGLVQERRNSSALAMELRLSCTNPSIPFTSLGYVGKIFL